MSIASQPLPGAVAVEEHNDVDHTSVSLAVSTVILALRPKETKPTRPCGCRWFAASASPIRASGRCPAVRSTRIFPSKRQRLRP